MKGTVSSRRGSRQVGRISFFSLFLGFFLLGIHPGAMAAKDKSLKPRVIYPVKQAVSQPVREMKAPLHPLKVKDEEAAQWIGYPRKRGDRMPRQPLAPAQEALLQQSLPARAMPETAVNFEGLNNIGGYYPPDTCGDVGPNHYVQITNVYFQVFTKSGTPLTVPLANYSLWEGFGGVCETTNHGDPIVLYDQYADRWLLSQFSVSGPFHQCIAISRTGDPTGEWHLYDYEMSATIMNDYPKFGVWSDGYYMAINQFDSASGYSWAGQGVVAFDRSAMLAGSSAAMVYIDMEANPYLGAMLPTDADGTTLPPAGAPNYFVQFDDDAWGYPADQLEVYEFHVDWATPANSTFTKSAVSPLAVAPFNTLNGTTVPQPGTTQLLGNLGDRLMYRLQYRNFGSHQAMVVNHTVDTTGTGNGIAGIRWYELRDSGGGWAVRQQGTYAGDSANSDHRWMGSIAMDSQGNMALGYSVSGAATYPSIRYTGRLVGDAGNTLGQGENTIIAGTGSQTGEAARWGDYSMMSVDPVDDCTFWYTQEYYQTTSAAGWQTRVASFKFPGCTAGPSGVLAGTVSDSGAVPIAGATVTADDGGSVRLATTTAADGSYGFASLPVGTYTVTAEKFGYTASSVPGVAVADGMTATQDIVLAIAPIHTLRGTVTDVATGWPLYAEVDYGPDSIWTDPATGMYAVDLPEGDYSVTATAAKYDTVGATLTLNSDTVQDFGLQADATCSATGYKSAAVLAEDFTGCALPAGWTVTNPGTDCEWVVSNPDPGATGNLTGGTGCFADADSDHCGSGTTMDTELVTPSVDCTGLSAVTLEFKYDVNDYENGDRFDVDVSIDGGSTWINVWQRLGVDDRGPKTAAVDITSIAAGQANVVVRFHYIAPDWDWWWQVDDVWIYENPADKTTCIVPADGGYVVGHVYDDNTGEALNGALVDDGLGHTATTAATPDDPNLGDGFYFLYLPTSGMQTLTAGKFGYGPVVEEVDVPLLGTAAQDFTLPAGQLSVDPGSVEVHIPLNSTLATPLSLTNNGSLAADFELLEINAAPPLRPSGPFAVPVRHMSPKHLHDTDAGGARYDYPVPAVPVIAAAGEVLRTWSSGLASPWGIGHQNDSATLWLGNIAAGGGDDLDYEYGLAGTPVGDTLDVAGTGGAYWMADFAYDWINNTLWQMNVGGDNCIHELDPASLTVTGSSICPAFGTSQRGLAYNPKTDTFYAGGWNDSTIHEFDRSGAILRSTNVGLPISGLAFNPVTDHLFVMVSDAASDPEVYVAAVPASGDFSVVGQFDIPAFTLDGGGAGLALDCDGHLWVVDQNTQSVYEVDSGEAGTCSFDIPWLSATPATGTVAAGSSQPVSLGFDSTGYAAGTEEAFIRIQNQTPYGSRIISVTMIVEPDRQLSVVKDGSGSGTVTADSGAVECGSTCTGYYPYNTSLTLTAAADGGSTFMGWSGDCTGNGTCTVTMDQARSVVAIFTDTTAATRDLGVSLTGSGSGGVTSSPIGIFCGTAGSTCTAPFADGVMVTLTAAAESGSTFMGWSGNCSGNGACTVTMDQARGVVATFTLIQYTVTASADGNGSGTIISDVGDISYAFPGQTAGSSSLLMPGSAITLTASAATGSTVSWSGCPATGGTAAATTCTFSSLDGDKTVFATFTLQSFALAVSKAGKGEGTVTSTPGGIECGSDCSEAYAYGSRVVLAAEPDSHSILAGWQGGCMEPASEPPAPVCTVDVQQAEEITVLFDHLFPWTMFLPAISGGTR